MKKIYITPETSLLKTYGEGLMGNHGSIVGQDGEGTDTIEESEGDPETDENGDYNADAKRFTYDPDWSDLDGMFEIF